MTGKFSKKKPDRRPLIRESAWRAADLTWLEKAYLVRVVDLPAEKGEDGRRRHASRAMDADGYFSLHRDYIATALGCSEDSVRSAQRGCIKKGYLGLVHKAAHGLPNRLQAYRSGRGISTGYQGAEIPSLGDPGGAPEVPGRGAKIPSLLYRAPDQGDHAPEPGDTRPAGVERRSNEERAAHGSFPRLTACEAHGNGDCDDVRCSPTDSRRRTA